mgnify:FL=1
MTLLFVLFGVGLLLELLLHVPGILWRSRKFLAAASLLVTAFASGMLLVAYYDTLWSILLLLASFYRMFNCLRIAEGRMHEQYLQRATLRTTVALALIQGLVGLLWWGWLHWDETEHFVWLLIALSQLGAALVLFSSTTRRLRRTAWPARAQHLSDSELPTLTVAIPARNETDDLQACLESLIASDYPKLEILVLDDCSQNRRTPEIIRSFAHAGVRFIEGKPHKPSWQPKTQAYAQLLHEANGEYVVFCGVDARFAPASLRRLVEVLLHKRKTMLCLLPRRAPNMRSRFAIVQAMRYAWELAPPRRLFRRPPVLSSCWIARREALKQAGGFEAVARSILPEAHFAKVLSGKNDGYSFMRGSARLGILSVKPAHAQHDTAIRMRYPQLRRRPENVFVLGQAYGFFLLMPFVLAVAGFWVPIGAAAQAAATLAALLHTLAFLKIVTATRTGTAWLGAIALPFGLLYDLALLHISMWKYEFSVIEWKGRNICIPAMRVISHLPKV